jgi:hypothetical protein
MTRTGPSAADRQLISQLAACDLTVSAAQLERWRHAGLLPRNSKRGRGRGRGSVSEASPETVEIAAVLSRHTQQGRDLRLAVIDWFADAGKPVMPEEPIIPEPPHSAVHTALMWVVSNDSVYRLFQVARSAHTDKEQDDFYDAAGATVRRWPRSVPGFDPAVVREALLTHQDPPDGMFRSGRKVGSGFIQLIAAAGMGYAEVGAEALSEAGADTGLAPSMSAAGWQWWLDRLEKPPPAGHAGYLVELLVTQYDPLEMLRLADAELLLRARTVAYGLARFGSLYLLHALGMPDTPGHAALRVLIDALGIGQMLLNSYRSMFTTHGFAFSVLPCLHPAYLTIHQLLTNQVANGPPLFPDNIHAAEKFMADWMTTLKNAKRGS